MVSVRVLDGDLAMLQHESLSAETILRMQAEFDALPPLATAVEKIDFDERIFYLDTVQMLASGQFEDFDNGYFQFSAGIVVDWNQVMRDANRWIDRMVSAQRLGSYHEKLTAMLEIEDDLLASISDADTVWWFLKPTSTVSIRMATMLKPTSRSLMIADYETDARRRMLRVAFGLARYRRGHGEYPGDLVELVPQYLRALPSDPFTDSDLHYQRTADGFVLYSVGKDQEDNNAIGPGDAVNWDIAIRVPSRPADGE